MKLVTIRFKENDYKYLLDFNRNINQLLLKVEINLPEQYEITALVDNKVINPYLSFAENEIANNEIIEIKEHNEEGL